MTGMEKHLLLRDLDVPNIRELDVYLANDGYAAWKKAVTSMKGEEVLATVKDSGITRIRSSRAPPCAPTRLDRIWLTSTFAASSPSPVKSSRKRSRMPMPTGCWAPI